MATQVTKDTVADPRAVTDDSNTDLLSGLLSKVVLFFDAQGRLQASHCEVERLRPWVSGLRHKPARFLPSSLRDLVEETLSSPVPTRQRELTIPSPSGVLELFQAHASPELGPSGQVEGATVAIYDLAPVRELGQNLGQLVRLASIGTLSAGLAHEIKNAMVAVHTFVDILADKHPESELAPIVGRELRRVDSIVAQMLRVSGPPRPNFQFVRIHELLDHALSVAQHRMAGTKITLERNLTADPDGISGDGSQLEQAFLNLLFNAIEAMGSHGRLTVTTRLEHAPDNTPFIRLTIADTGSGIPTESLHRIFEPFYTTKPSGHGLGLVITRRIILEHRGAIEVQSQAGEGTVFTVDLPSAARQP